MNTPKQFQRRVQGGFTLIEMAIVLVIIGLIIGAVAIGKDVQRNAEYQKVANKFAMGWKKAYDEHYQRTGVVLGDVQTSPTYMVNGAEATIGGTTMAAGGNLNPDQGGVSMFEPMGGSAPKYTGQNVINPIAAICAMAMLLEHTGQEASARQIMQAVQHVTGTKMKSQAAGKMGYGTREVGDLVVAALG